MAGVDHAYQYSVEVKSRFSLFMDEALNDEDPDILMSKLQNERLERSKKDKAQVLPTGKSDKKVELEKPQSKSQPASKPTQPMTDNQPEVAEHQEKYPAVPPQRVFRGRVGPRGYSRGYRGFRGHAPRSHQGDFSSDAASVAQRDYSEGRGRYRPRGGFYRGRPANTDVRELPEQAEHVEQIGQSEDSPSTWDDSPSDHVVSNGKTSAGVEDVLTENHEAEKTEEKEEEKPAPTYTLEEYKAMRSQEKPAVTLADKESRKPNDGEDVFANMVPHRKIVEVEEDEYVKVEAEEEEPNKIEINVLFNDDRGSRGRQNRGFANRGFPRGGRPRGRPRMDRGGRGTFRGDTRGHHEAPRVIYNDQEFPSLK